MDRELEQLLKDVMFELKDMTRVLRGTNKKLIEDTKTKDQERKAKKLLIKTMGCIMSTPIPIAAAIGS